jgi:anaerobic ribonucleoside-triphosphate reductase activating protein
MRIHKILGISNTNGPGFRFVVWVQGCCRKCCGCFNPKTHDPCGGYEIGISEIISEIPLAEIDGITVSGGEPFEQPKDLLALLDNACQIGLHRLVYTGYTYEELQFKRDINIEKCLMKIDLLIDGAFKKENLPYMPWTGSGNQRLIQLNNGKIKKIYKKSDLKLTGIPDGEIIIDTKGSILTTGIIDSRMFIV